MVNKILLTAAVGDALFLGSGILELVFAAVINSRLGDVPSTGKAATRSLVHHNFPINAGMANAALILVTFALTLPGFFMRDRRILKAASYMVLVCAVFTLCVGVSMWVQTLRIKTDFYDIYMDQDPHTQSLIQTSFECCGYYNHTRPAFVTDSTCTSPAAAALLRGCATSMSSYANGHIDNVFTALFGMVGIHAIFFLCIACLLKDRKERERYRLIDEKADYQQF